MRPLRQRWQPAWTARLKNRRVEVLRRRGKWIVAELDGGFALLIHLGMTGQLRVLPKVESVAQHTHLIFDLDFHRLQLEIYGFNERAQRHAERAGFVHEGARRKAYWRHGEWVDGVLYGLVREDLEP